jgi:hypothetical protein
VDIWWKKGKMICFTFCPDWKTGAQWNTQILKEQRRSLGGSLRTQDVGQFTNYPHFFFFSYEESVNHLFLYCNVILLYEILFSVALECLELCLDGLSSYLIIGRRHRRVGRRVLRCEKWRILASFGAYREKQIIEALRIWRRPYRIHWQ